MYNEIIINPLYYNLLDIQRPPKIDYVCQGKIVGESTIMNSKYIYTCDNTDIKLTAIRKLCGFDILAGNKSIYTLRRNMIGSRYYGKILNIQFKTSLFKRKIPRSFVVEYDNIRLCNKEPFYNIETSSYSLNFNGRVTVPSVKNFQLVHPTDKTYIILTFGKISEDTYIIDYKYPLDGVCAFSICLAALDGKYFCD